jgi:hypothetical protein
MSYAAVRPDAWNLPLFVHVLGAMVFVAVLAAVVAVLAAALRSDDRAPAIRFAFRTLLFGGIPAYIVMRGGSEWIASKEDLADSDASWIGIGYSVADGGLLLLLVMTVLAGLAARRARAGGQPTGLVRWTTALALIVIVAYGVAIWAMATKPA